MLKSENRPTSYSVWLLLFSVAAGITACGNTDDETMEAAIESQLRAAGQQGDVDVDSEEGTIKYKFETEEGSVETAWSENRLPDDFPSDVPLYRDARLLASSSLNQVGQKGYSVHSMTSDAVDAVQKQLSGEASASGWEQVMIQSMEGMAMLMYKKDKRNLSYTISPGEDGTSITTTVVEQPSG